MYCSSALISSTATWLLLTVFGRTPTFYLSSMAVYPLVALSVCLIRAADTQRQDEERQLRSALSRQALDAARIHAELMHTRRGLARLLHSSVQGELVAAAWSSGAVAGRPVDVAATIATFSTAWKATCLRHPISRLTPMPESVSMILSRCGATQFRSSVTSTTKSGR